MNYKLILFSLLSTIIFSNCAKDELKSNLNGNEKLDFVTSGIYLKSSTIYQENEPNDTRLTANGPFDKTCVIAGNFSGDQDWFKLSPIADNDKLILKVNTSSSYWTGGVLIGSNPLGQFNGSQEFIIENTTSGDYFIGLEGMSGYSYLLESKYYIRSENEPNNTKNQANGGILENIPVTGDVAWPDEDWLFFDVKSSGIQEILYLDNLKCSNIEIYSDNNSIGGTNPNASWKSYLQEGRYYLKIGGYNTNYEVILNPDASKYLSSTYKITTPNSEIQYGIPVDIVYCENNPNPSSYFKYEVEFANETFVYTTFHLSSGQKFVKYGTDSKGNPIIYLDLITG